MVWTRADGSYALRPPAGPAELQVEAFGFFDQTTTVAVPSDGTTEQDVTLTPLPERTISGTVHDELGSPIEDATVAVRDTSFTVLTDAAGGYSLVVPAGEYTLGVRGPSACVESASQDVDVTGGDVLLDVELATRADAFGYRCTPVPLSLEPGTERLNLGAFNSSVRVDLPFPFPFYGGNEDSVSIHTAGYLSFIHGPSSAGNGPIPSQDLPNAAIYPHWGDVWMDYLPLLSPSPDQGIYVGTHGTAPNRHFVVEYRDVDMGSPGTFAAVLHEDGAIELHYERVPGQGQRATVGLENHGGTAGFQYTFGEPALLDGLALRFTAG